MSVPVSRFLFGLGALVVAACDGDGGVPPLPTTEAAVPTAQDAPSSAPSTRARRSATVEQFVAQLSNHDQVAPKAFSTLAREYEGPLTAGITDASLGHFVSAISDDSLSLEARVVMLRSLIAAEGQLGLAGRREHLTSLRCLLTSDATPGLLKGVILGKIGAHELFEDADLFTPYLHSSDAHLRTMAWRGLGSHIATNRARHREHSNQALLTQLRADSALLVDSAVVRALAEMGSDDAHAFLTDAVGKDASLLATWLFHDPNLQGRQVALQALDSLQTSENRQELTAALRVGLKHPDAVVGELLAGAGNDLLKGLGLLDVFGELVPSHAREVLDAIHSTDSTIREAGLRLIPRLDAPAAVTAELSATLPDETARKRFQQQLTAAIAR
jgi:hypothetical protein